MNNTNIKNSTDSDEPVANCDQLILSKSIETCIFTIRDQQVLIDKDIAALYGVDTKRLNEQVKRNSERFPERFRFQLTKEETNRLIANCDRFNSLKHSSTHPYAFTEQGIAMLSTVLRSNAAVTVSIRIMDAFVSMRKFIISNAQLFQRIDKLETNQIETNHRIEEIFERLESHEQENKQGIFLMGRYLMHTCLFPI